MNDEMESKNQKHIDAAADRMTAREAEQLQEQLRRSNLRIEQLEKYRPIVVELCERWNCYPEKLVELIDISYAEGTQAAEKLIEVSAHLGNLLATIHQDGGQYQQDNGTEQAVTDAVGKWHDRTRHIDELEGLLSACFKDDERVFDALIDAQNPHHGMCKAGYPDNNFPCACRYRAAVKAHYKTKDNLLAKWRPK